MLESSARCGERQIEVEGRKKLPEEVEEFLDKVSRVCYNPVPDVGSPMIENEAPSDVRVVP